MSRICLITTEPVPLPGWPTTGAGLRAWSLAEALRGRGHEVTLLIPDDALQSFTPPECDPPPDENLPAHVGRFARAELAKDSRPREAEAVVLQHWGLAPLLGEIETPLAIDLAGPHWLERKLWASTQPERDLTEKLDALRRADFVTASGARQRLYFLPFLEMAGWDLAGSSDALPVIPYSLPAAEKPAPPRADRFVYGGFFLPWQDPSAALEAVLDELEFADRGKLLLIGGAHPHADVSGGRFDTLMEKLESRPRVERLAPMSYDLYLALLAEGGIALDLMARNVERELAFTTRTVRYLASGLPVIHNNFSELGQWIGAAGAGWTFDPADAEGLRSLVRDLLSGKVDPSAAGEAARRLVVEKLDPAKTIEPLARFCEQPRHRVGKVTARLAFEDQAERMRETQADLNTARDRLNTLLGKRWVRWGLKFLSPSGLAALPLALLASLFGVLLIPVFWIAGKMKG